MGFSKRRKERKKKKKETNTNKQTNKNKAFNVVGRDLNDFSVVDTSSALRGKNERKEERKKEKR